MCRWRAKFPIIVRRTNDALAKVVLPDAIHHHAGGERIVLARNPARQFPPPASAQRRLFTTRNRAREMTRNLLPEAIVFAAHHDASITKALINALRRAALLQRMRDRHLV